jgi:hypothetical protein
MPHERQSDGPKADGGSETADGTNYRVSDDPGSEMADGSNYRGDAAEGSERQPMAPDTARKTSRPRPELRLVAAAFSGFRHSDFGQSEGVLNPASFK